jgi:transcriptional regulator with XRE-family HTH domain
VISVEIGRRVRQRRVELQLTQEQLAERSGVSRNQVQNIENARGTSTSTSNPRADLLWSLAVALEVDVGDLFPTLASQRKSVRPGV